MVGEYEAHKDKSGEILGRKGVTGHSSFDLYAWQIVLRFDPVDLACSEGEG